MIAPPRIARGGTLGVVAPAGPVRPGQVDKFRRGLARLATVFDLALAPSVTEPGTRAHPAGVPGYLSASDDERAAELTAMLANPDVRGIILARAGYGIMRILPRLDPELVRRDPKPIVGFSDGTALLAWAHAAGVRGIHGPTVIQLAELPDSDVERLVTLLTDPTPPGVQTWQLATAGRGTVRGPLVPANLTMASMLVGTPWPVLFAGAIALFEEVGEKPYEIDRYLTQLALTGALADVAAVIVGELVRCEEPKLADPTAALRTLRERLGTTPHASGAPIGHGDRNESVPFGAACELDLDRSTFAILEAAVS